MGFRNGNYASIFSVKKGNGNYYDVNLATSRKDASGEFKTDFRGFARFVGKAADLIAVFDGRDAKNEGNHPIGRIKLGDVDVTNNFSAKNNTTYTNYVVFTCEFANKDNGANGNGGGDVKSMNDYVNSTTATGTSDEDLFT